MPLLPSTVYTLRVEQSFQTRKYQSAEVVRFELTVSFPTTVFKTAALNHSATLTKTHVQTCKTLTSNLLVAPSSRSEVRIFGYLITKNYRNEFSFRSGDCRKTPFSHKN